MNTLPNQAFKIELEKKFQESERKLKDVMTANSRKELDGLALAEASLRRLLAHMKTPNAEDSEWFAK